MFQTNQLEERDEHNRVGNPVKFISSFYVPRPCTKRCTHNVRLLFRSIYERARCYLSHPERIAERVWANH